MEQKILILNCLLHNELHFVRYVFIAHWQGFSLACKSPQPGQFPLRFTTFLFIFVGLESEKMSNQWRRQDHLTMNSRCQIIPLLSRILPLKCVHFTAAQKIHGMGRTHPTHAIMLTLQTDQSYSQCTLVLKNRYSYMV